MTLEIGAIIAIALAATATLSDILHIPKKLRAWTALLLIIVLNVGNEWLFFPSTFSWRESLFEGLTAGLAAVGIYSTTKNTREQLGSLKTPTDTAPSTAPMEKQKEDDSTFSHQNNPYV